MVPSKTAYSGFSGGASSSTASNPSPRNSSCYSGRMISPRRGYGYGDASQSCVLSTSSASPQPSPVNSTPLRGHLWKQSPSFLRAFQRRYVVVEEGRISWHAPAKANSAPGAPPPAEGDVKGSIDLTKNACEVVLDMENPDRFTIQPIGGRWRDASFTGANTGRAFYFDATGSEYSRAWWAAAIKRHIQLGQGQSSGSSRTTPSGRASLPATAFGSRPVNEPWSARSEPLASCSGGFAAPPRRQSAEWRQSPPPLLPSQVRPNAEDPSFNYQKMDDDDAGWTVPVANPHRSVAEPMPRQKPPPLDADYYNTDHDEIPPSWQQEVGMWPSSVLGPVPSLML